MPDRWLTEATPLEAAWVHLTTELRHGVDTDAVEGELARLAGAALARPTPSGLVAVLVDAGFIGDIDDYDAPANSLVDEVLARRRGLPIALAALAIAVGDRAGVAVHGVGMPGHFLLGGDDGSFYDLFHGGQVLDVEGSRALHARLFGGAGWAPSLLTPTPTAAIVQRMLANLQRSFQRRGETLLVAKVLRLRAGLPGAGGGLEPAAVRLEATMN